MNYREESRKEYGNSRDDLSVEELKAGALLRIADATELMAKRYSELIDSRDSWERTARSRQARIETLQRRNAALRGHITRIKKGLV